MPPGCSRPVRQDRRLSRARLDLDGTLIETRRAPAMARDGPRMGHVLARLVAATRGATMTVSGRAVATNSGGTRKPVRPG